MSRAVVGLDLSLSGAGVVSAEGEHITPRLIVSRPLPRVAAPGGRKVKGKPKMIVPVWDRAERLREHARLIVAAARLHWPELVCIESPSFASKYGSPHERSGLWWLVVTELRDLGYTVAEIPPSSLKLYATGSGAASKASVVAAMVDRHQLSFTDDNMVDALALAAMGSRHLGRPLEADLPDRNITALDAVLWPN